MMGVGDSVWPLERLRNMGTPYNKIACIIITGPWLCILASHIQVCSKCKVGNCFLSSGRKAINRKAHGKTMKMLTWRHN